MGIFDSPEQVAVTLSDLSVGVLIAASALVSLVAWRIALRTRRRLGV